MDELIPKPVDEFVQALLSTEIADIAVDFAELGIDSLFDNGSEKENIMSFRESVLEERLQEELIGTNSAP